MEKIIIQPWVVDDLMELVNILFEKEYFGFLESAEDHVRTIIKFIYTIPKQRKRKTLNPVFGTYDCQYIAKVIQLIILVLILRMIFT